MATVNLTYREVKDTGKTKVWSVHSGDMPLGQITWYSNWRRYVFWPDNDTLFDVDCLLNITSFIKGRMQDYKREKAKT